MREQVKGKGVNTTKGLKTVSDKAFTILRK